ncbi:Mitochondrial transcription termination factor family protein [Euphorbia peplus]|nr:Mitochondrial transcription termination factor family protein [Euphorbia peplus]
MPPWICRIPSFQRNHFFHKVPNFAHKYLLSFSTTSTPKISTFDYLVNRHNFSPKCATKVSSSLSTKYLNKHQNADSVLNFLKDTDFSKNQIEAVIQKVPRLLSADLEKTIKPKVKIFRELGIHSGADFAKIISSCPWLLNNSSADRLRLSVSVLKNALGPNADIVSFLTSARSRRLLMYDLSTTMVPNIEYLKSCGICSLQIAAHVCYCPMTFINKPETFKCTVQRVDEMGVDRNSKMFIEAIRVMRSLSRENWELKWKLFSDLGFSDQNIVYAFRVYPGVFTVSGMKIKEVTHLLLSVVDISYIAVNPRLLSLSVEKRLKPRLQVLKALESKNLLKRRPGFSAFFHLTNAMFMKRYVTPYSNELGDLYAASQQILMKHS